jgi:YidC/Oxa1 family membrane protein insertase
MINVVIVLSDALFGSFGLSIIVLTIISRVVLFPLTRRQLRSTKQMQELQPKIAEIRKKYARDKQKRAQEEMALMKQSGVNPAGCILPMLVQMPIWIALYQSIIRVLAVTPEEFLNLSRHLYTAWPSVFAQVPLNNMFLGLNLSQPNMVMPVLVGGSMWLQQKMTTPQSTDPAQRAQGQMMQWMMPLMFMFLTFSFPSGLALYWVVSNVISMVMQYFIGGWGGLATVWPGRGGTPEPAKKRPETREKKALTTEDGEADIVVSREEGYDDGQSGDKRADGGGGYSDSIGAIRRQSRRSKGRRSKRR